MSRSDFAAKSRVEIHCAREAKSELVRLGWIKLIERFEKDRDFPLDHEKPVIDNSVRPAMVGLRVFPRPCRGAKRAYLRRRARELVCA